MTAPWRILARACQRLLPPSPGGLTVLTYHLVGAGTRSPVDIDRAVFRAQMEEIRRIARPLPLATGVAALAGGDGGQPLVAVTFDDGFQNFLERAWPILAELEIPSTLYLPVAFLERQGPAPLTGAENLPPLGWPELRQLVATGLVEVGSHSWSHPDLRRLRPAALRQEIAGSQSALADRTGARVESFSYPRGLWCAAAEREVARSYRSAVIGGGRKNRGGAHSAYRLRRVPVRREMSCSLAAVVGSRIWLEEWLASGLRRYRAALVAR